MAIEREAQVAQDEHPGVPGWMKEVVTDKESLRYFADAVQDAAAQGMPSPSEMTHAGTRRTFGPVSPFNGYTGLGLYTSANIPLHVLDIMRRDSQMALGMAIVKYPISNLGYTLNCKNPTIKKFIKENLDNKWATILKDSLKAMDFGFTGFEKVWKYATLSFDPGLSARKVRDRDFIVLQKLKPIHPVTMTARTDTKGNFAGINQDRTGENTQLPRNKSMIITNDEEFGNFFGKSRMIPAYEPWYWKQISVQFFLRYIERFSIPPYAISFPPGQTRFAGGVQMDNAKIATNMGAALGSYGNVAVPSTTDDKGNRKWSIDPIQQPKLNMKPQDIIGFWDIMMLRGLLIPDVEAISGLSSRDAAISSSVFLSTLGEMVKQIQEKVNKEVVAPLVAWNFTEEEREECTLNIDDIDFNKHVEMRKLFSKILDLSASYAKNMGGLPFKQFPDMGKILEMLDIPATDIGVFVPQRYDPDGNKIEEEEPEKEPGPDKGEKTEGNQAREGRDGNPRDDDKTDETDEE